MALRVDEYPTLNEIIVCLDTKHNTPDLAQAGCFHDVANLIVRNQCTNIVELHSPHKMLSCALCCAFDDVNITTICKEHTTDHVHDNLTCVQDWSSNMLDNFEDGSLDLIYFHDHDQPSEELYDTLTNWLKKIKPGGILCGTHWGAECKHMSSRGYALYEFARTENLCIQSEGTNTFVCINDPMPAEKALAPIRLEELND